MLTKALISNIAVLVLTKGGYSHGKVCVTNAAATYVRRSEFSSVGGGGWGWGGWGVVGGALCLLLRFIAASVPAVQFRWYL